MNLTVEEQNECIGRSLISELVRLGVNKFFIAPGSRSTPLILAIEDNAKAEAIRHYDERSLAFAALGYGKATHQPACIVTTSGTAIANLYPAVLEAYYDRVPLFVITADRPPELQDIGANQTIDQVKFYERHCKWETTLYPFDTLFTKELLASNLSCAYYHCLNSPAGPVVLNCMIREPFFTSSKKPKIHNFEEPSQGTSVYFSERFLSEESLAHIAKSCSKYEKGLIVVGKLDNEEDVEAILELSMQMQWPVLADTLSNIRALGSDSASIAYYNHILQATTLKQKLVPQAILYLGGALVSKPLIKWLKAVKPKKFLHVGNFPSRHDPELLVTEKVEMEPTRFATLLMTSLEKKSPTLWFSMWKEYSLSVEEAITEFLEASKTLSEPFAIFSLKHPKFSECHYFFSNSLSVRYADTFFFPKGGSGKLFGSRGVSGIDGILSTAIGIAKGLNERVIAITGDLAFLHDVTALSLLKTTGAPLTIIALNNYGGGIYHFLPISEKKELLDSCFSVDHSQNLAEIAKAYKIPVQQVMTQSEYEKALEQSLNKNGPMIIEVLSDRKANRKFHDEIEKHMQKKLLRNKKEKELCFFTTKKDQKIVTL